MILSETITLSHTQATATMNEVEVEERSFITANTLPVTIRELKDEHLIPVFVKDNEPVISQFEFIQTMQDVASSVFVNEQLASPVIRVSHPIKGRIPEAKDKPAANLEEWEKTLYYERMAFVIELPGISDTVDGNLLSLTIGGVKSHAADNLYNKTGVDEHFKIFVGFQNKVCTNTCVWTDGLMNDLRVKNIGQLRAAIKILLEAYNSSYQLFHMKRLCDYALSEKQFASLVGRCRMYQHLPPVVKNDIPALLFGDNHLNAVCKDYYRDQSFCRNSVGDINLWRLYNLFTGANKSSYIDSFLERSVNAFDVVEGLRNALEGGPDNWYLS